MCRIHGHFVDIYNAELYSFGYSYPHLLHLQFL